MVGCFCIQDAKLRPLVKIFVWRKDYYAAQIVQLVQLRDRVITDLNRVQGEKGHVTGSVNELSARIFALQQQRGVIQKDLEDVNARLVQTQANLGIKVNELEEARRCLMEDAPLVRSLIDFLAISGQMGLMLGHPAVAGFEFI